MVELRTKRLLLRRAKETDTSDLHAVFSDPRAMRYWSELPYTDPAQTLEFIRGMQAIHDRSPLEFMVEHEGRAIGKTGIFDGEEIGYIFHPDTWGQGFAAEAITAVCQHAIETVGLIRVTADVDPRHAVSIHLLCKLGFVGTDRAEKTLQLGDEWCDSIYYALSPGNFRAALRALRTA